MAIVKNTRLLRRALPITTALLAAILLVTIGLTYYLSNRILVEKLAETNQAVLREVVGRFDAALAIADHLLVAAMSDPDVSDHMTSEYADRSQRLIVSTRIQLRLAGIRRSLPFVQSIVLVSFRQGVILSDVAGAAVGEYPVAPLVEAIRSASVEGGISPPQSIQVLFWSDPGTDEVVMMTRPFPLGSSMPNASGGVVAIIPLSAVRQEMLRFTRNLGFRVAVADRDGRPLVALGVVGDAPTAGGGWVSQPVQSTQTGWFFVATGSPGRAEIGVARFRAVVLVIVICGMAAAVVTMVIFDRSFRKPWQDSVLALAAEAELREGLAAGSLDELTLAITEALNRGRQMEWKYEASRSAVTWQVITRYLLAPREDPDNAAALKSLGLNGPLFQVLLVDARAGESALEELWSRGLVDLAALRAITLPDGLIAVVACPHDEELFVRRCAALVVALRRQSGRGPATAGVAATVPAVVAAAVGGAHTGTAGIHTSYVEATFALEFALVRPEETLIVYRQVAGQGVALVPRRAAELLRALGDIVRRREPAVLRGWADRFLAAVTQDSLNPVAFKHSIARFVSDTAETATRLGISLPATDRDFHHAVWAGRNRSDIERVFFDALDYYCAAVAGAALSSGSDARGRALVQVVDELLDRVDLSLTLVADRFGASVAHTSRLFRRTTAVTFQEYVAVQRVERAQRLLTTTHHPVAEVGRLVGFAEVHTFIRTFKRKVGLTPAEFRRAGGVPKKAQ